MNHDIEPRESSPGAAPLGDAPPSNAATADERLERELDELASRVRRSAGETGAGETSAGEAHWDAPYDDRDYHALAQGFHAARKSYLEAERPPAVLHRFPERDEVSVPTARKPKRFSAWVACAAIAAGVALIAWTAFGGSAATNGGAPELFAPGNVRGNGDAIELRLERDGEALRFAWSAKTRSADARHTLRIYPQGSLRALVVHAHLAGDTALLDASGLRAGEAYEAEVELETETGIAPASARLAFVR